MQKEAHSQLHPNGILNKTWMRFKYSVCIICIQGIKQLLLHEAFSCFLGGKLRPGNGLLYPVIQIPCIQNTQWHTKDEVERSPFPHITFASTMTQISHCMCMHCSTGVFLTIQVTSPARTSKCVVNGEQILPLQCLCWALRPD